MVDIEAIRKFETALIDISANGPASVGLAAGADRVRLPTEALRVAGTMLQIYKSAFYSTYACAAEFPKVHRVLIGAGGLIAANKWFDATCNVIDTDAFEANDFDAKGEAMVIYDITKEELAQAMHLVYAVKINWWQMNHHVGQGSFAGYVAKVIPILFGDGAVKSNAVFNSVWVMSHWVSTTQILNSLEITGIDPAIGAYKILPPADDIKIRANGFPAGTAKVAVCHAVVKRIIGSVFASVLPPIPDLMQLINSVNLVLKDPASFHVGARILKKDGKRNLPDLSDDLLRYCSAYVHSALKGSTLSRAKVLLPIEEVKGEEVFTRVVAINTALAKRGMNDENALLLVSGSGAGLTAVTFQISNMSDEDIEFFGASPDFIKNKATDLQKMIEGIPVGEEKAGIEGIDD